MIESSESQSLVCENDILFVDVVSDWEELTYVDWSDSIKEYLIDENLWDILEVEDDEDASTEDDEVVGVENNDVVGADDNEVAGAEDNEVVGVENNDVVGADDNEIARAENSEVAAGAGKNEVAGAGKNEVAGADDNEVARDEHRDRLKKNAKALYLIMETCGSKRFSLISDIHSAKDAWRALRDAHDEEMFGKYLDSKYDPGSYSSPLSRKYTCSIILK